MKIGVISDSHDNQPKIKKAVEIFNKQKVDLLLHAGDYVAPFSLIPFDYLNCEYFGVFGNNDGEREGLTKKSGGRITEGPQCIYRVSKTIILAHSLEQVERVGLQNKSAHLIIYGHTHKPLVHMEGGTLWLNPGECGGWLTGVSTIAVVDINTLSYQIINI